MRYAGHSLRAGLATAAAIAGAEERDDMRGLQHTSVAVARRYIRDGAGAAPLGAGTDGTPGVLTARQCQVILHTLG